MNSLIRIWEHVSLKIKHQEISLQTSSVKLYMSSNVEPGGGGGGRGGSLYGNLGKGWKYSAGYCWTYQIINLEVACCRNRKRPISYLACIATEWAFCMGSKVRPPISP